MANKKYSKEFKVEALVLADQVGGAQLWCWLTKSVEPKQREAWEFAIT